MTLQVNRRQRLMNLLWRANNLNRIRNRRYSDVDSQKRSDRLQGTLGGRFVPQTRVAVRETLRPGRKVVRIRVALQDSNVR